MQTRHTEKSKLERVWERMTLPVSQLARRQTPSPNTVQWIFPRTDGQRQHPVWDNIKLSLKKSNSTSLSAAAIPPPGETENSPFFNDGAEAREYSGRPTLNTMSQFRPGKKKTART